MELFSKKSTIKNILVFDIGTSSVGGFWVRKTQGTIPEVRSQTKFPLRLLEKADLKSMMEYMKKTLEDTAAALKEAMGTENPEKLFAVLSSPWFLSETRIVRVAREADFTVTEKLLEKLIQEEIVLFKKRSEENFSVASDKLRILECQTMKILLNGYPVSSPNMKKTRELLIHLYMSISRSEFIESAEEVLNRYFGNTPVKFKSEPLALFNILKEMVDCEEGFLLVDVGGEITEISLIRHCVIEQVSTFSKGGNFMVRRIASSVGAGLEESLAFLKSKTRGDLKPDIDKKISQILEDAGAEWRKLLTEALTQIGKSNTLPQNLILTGGASGIEALKKYSESADLSHLTILGKPFNVIILMPENLESRINPGFSGRKDPQLTLPLLLALEAVGDGGK